jgi:hypothetical protein
LLVVFALRDDEFTSRVTVVESASEKEEKGESDGEQGENICLRDDLKEKRISTQQAPYVCMTE